MKTGAQRVREQGQAAKWVNGALLHLFCQPTPQVPPSLAHSSSPTLEPDGRDLILWRPVGGGVIGRVWVRASPWLALASLRKGPLSPLLNTQNSHTPRV